MADRSLGYGVYLNEISRAIGSVERVDDNNGIVSIISTKGVVNKPIFVSSQSVFNGLYGSEDIGENKCIDSALRFLETGNGLWVNRIGGGFEYYNLFDFEFNLSGTNATFSGDESYYTAKGIDDALYVNGVTSDDVDLKTIQTTDLAENVNFRLYTKYPIDLEGYTVSIKEDENYEINDVADSDDEFYFPANQVFRYQLLDKDGFVVGSENFLFSLVDGVVDFNTNQDIYVEEAFKRSSIFGAVFGEIIPTSVTDNITTSTTYTTESVLIANGAIDPNYDYETYITGLNINPVGFFFNDRAKYPAIVMFEGGLEGQYDTIGKVHEGIKAPMCDWLKAVTKARGDIVCFYDTYNISNLEFQGIINDFKSNKSVLFPTSFSYERDCVTTDWGEFSKNGRTVQLPDSPKYASDFLNYYKTVIVEPMFGKKGALVKNYLSPVKDIQRIQEPTMIKYRVNMSRGFANGYFPMIGLTSHNKAEPERDLHVQSLKVFILKNLEPFLENFIGEFNDVNTETEVLIGVDEILSPIKGFLDADIQVEYTRPDRESVQLKIGILPTSAIKYVYLTLVTYDNSETLNSDFS